MQRVAVLGATGSIGTSALDVLSRYPEDFCVYALAAGTRIEKLVDLAARFHPEVVGIADQEKVKAFWQPGAYNRYALSPGPRTLRH